MKNFYFLLFSFLLCFNCKGQTIGISKQDTLNYYELENLKTQKLTEIYMKSANVLLPDSVYTILKEFAKNKNRPLELVMKQQFLLKVIYNTNLTIEERLLGCNNLIKQYSRVEPAGPLFLVNNIKKNLLSINK